MSRRLMAHSLTAAVTLAALLGPSTTIASATDSPVTPVREVADATGAGWLAYPDVIPALDSRSYTVTFSRGAAQIIVDGDGDTDLDCRVYDSQGTLVAADLDGTDYCVLRWFQWVRGPVQLEIVNLGYVSNYFQISTN